MGLLCAPCLTCQSASRLNKSCFLYGILSLLCPCLSVCLLRGSARAKYGIEGNCCGDAICATCCYPCANCQIANEVDTRR